MRFSIAEGDGDRHGRWSGRLDGSAVLTYEATFDAAALSRPIPPIDPGGKYPTVAKDALEASPGIDSTRSGGDRAVDRADPRCDEQGRARQQVYEFVAREIGTLRSAAAWTPSPSFAKAAAMSSDGPASSAR